MSFQEEPIKLSTSIVKRILLYADFPTILAFRETSDIALYLATKELKDSLHNLLSPFFGLSVESFLSTLDAAKGIIGGEVAVAFLARGLTWKPIVLNIYIPSDAPSNIHRLLTNDIGMGPMKSSSKSTTAQNEWALPRSIDEHHQWNTNAKSVNLYRTSELIPSVPIVSSFATHLFTFITGRVFVTAYPKLFFKYRALLGKCMRTGIEADEEEQQITWWRNLGMDVQMDGRYWGLEGGDLCGPWMCPREERSFGDGGSFKGCIDGTDFEAELLDLNGEVWWKLDTRMCSGRRCNSQGKQSSDDKSLVWLVEYQSD